MAGSSVSSVEGTRAGSYDAEDVQAAAPQPAEVGIAAAEAIRIWDYLIGSNLGGHALRVVLASNAENAAVLFRLRLVARRFHSELPKYVASLNFSGLNIPLLSDELFIWRHIPFSNLSNLTTSPDQSETQRRIKITVRLGESIGVTIDTEGYVKDVTPGGQLKTNGGINVGDRIVEAGGTSLGTAELDTTTWGNQVKCIIQEKTHREDKSLGLTFEQVRAPLLSSDVWCL